MSVAGFAVVAFMLTAYVILDGYDLGAALVSPLVARDERERSAIIATIGPFWNGNEVWLIAAGGALFALFPRAYASAFSGFYLPFIVVLWLLILRGIALELRDHFPSPLWRGFWDVTFTASSALLIAIFGVALGNLIRGVPLDEKGYFQGTFAFLLNPYALLVGVLAMATLAMHGANFVAMRTEGGIYERALRAASTLWWFVAGLWIAMTVATFAVRGGVPPEAPWLYVLPGFSLAALALARVAAVRRHPRTAFTASSAFIASLLVTAAATMYPYLLPGFPAGRSAGGISVVSAAPSPVAMATALTATILGICIVVAYSLLVARRMRGKVSVED